MAACRCGALTATCRGESVRISVCHCLACQQRTGSAFSSQARFPDEKVRIDGAFKTFGRTGDAGGKVTYGFCPECGTTVFYTIDDMPGVTAVPIGGFTDPDFPPPRFSVYEERKRPWLEVVGEDIERS